MTKQIEHVDVRRYSDPAAAHEAGVGKMVEAIAALQAKVKELRDADPAKIHWGHAGSAAALANALVDLANGE